MLIEIPKPYRSGYITLDFPKEEWEHTKYRQLRRDIFCHEQKIFRESDIDIIDKQAIPIIALSQCMGMTDQVVGVVRIDEREPGLWYGSRLGVDKEYRSYSRFQTFKLFEKDTIPPFNISIGASLIYKAVSTATALGCDRFLAHVQEQNVKFFRRLHWDSLKEVTLHGRVHHLMKADLNYYQPSVFISELTSNSA